MGFYDSIWDCVHQEAPKNAGACDMLLKDMPDRQHKTF